MNHEGKRFFRLSEASSNRQSDVEFVTKTVPNELLKKKDLLAIAMSVPLDGGTPFSVDAHGIWLTEAEAIDLSKNISLDLVRWHKHLIPTFPPR